MTDIHTRLELLDQSAKLLEHYARSTGRFDALRPHMAELCTLSELMRVSEEAVNQASSPDDYERRVQAHLETFDVNSVCAYREFGRCDNNNNPSPTPSSPPPSEDIETITETVATIDPVSKRPISTPVRNRRCNHVYDKSSILGLIRKNPKTRCPNVGCKNKVVRTRDLIEDAALKELVSQTQRETVRREPSQIFDLDDSTTDSSIQG